MKFRLSLLYFITTLVIFGVISVSKANAQFSSSISASIVPPNPDPYEETSITLSSYTYKLDSLLISWSVNGKTVASGTGKKSFSTTAPAAGEETSVIATISLPESVIEKKISIKSSVMVLLWQANDSYVPPFYRGKALPTPDSEVKVVAMPEIRSGSSNVPAQNMTYYWKKDYTNNVDGSGYGKNFFLYVSDYLEDSNNISVTASTVDQNNSSQASIDIGTAQPKILFYRNESSTGTIWEHSLPNPLTIQGPEVVEAIPYFISPKELLHPALVWNWFINDNRINLTTFKKNLMPLAVEEETHGTSKLRLEIQNKDKIFQTPSKEITVEF